MPNFFIKNWFSTLCIFFIFAVQLHAQTEVRAELDTVVETGNPFVLHLQLPEVLGVTPTEVDFSAWDTIIPSENILAQTAWQHNAAGYAKDITLITFDTDSLQLPPLTVVLKGGGKALSNPLLLRVIATPSPDDLRDMADIKDIRQEPFSWRSFLYANRQWFLLALGILILFFIGYQLFRQKYRSDAAQSRRIQLPPHEYALRRLAALEQKQFQQPEQSKLFYAELTHILREYLENRFQVPALESVSDEILRTLSRTEFPEILLPNLQKLLMEADLAKFAQSTPPASFQPEAWHIARTIVMRTMETQVVEPNSAP